MAQLSELVALYKDMQGQKHQPGKPGARSSAQAPALPGMARGTMGSLGSRLFKGRDSGAGARKELELMQSPVFQAFMQKMTPGTPVSDYLRGVV